VAAGVAAGAGTVHGRIKAAVTMMALACRDFPRRHAKFIDIPITDDHLNRGRRRLIADASDDASLGVASPVVVWLLAQTLKLNLCCIGIVSHDSPHQFCEIMLSMLCGGNHPRHYQSISTKPLCFGHSRGYGFATGHKGKIDALSWAASERWRGQAISEEACGRNII